MYEWTGVQPSSWVQLPSVSTQKLFWLVWLVRVRLSASSLQEDSTIPVFLNSLCCSLFWTSDDLIRSSSFRYYDAFSQQGRMRQALIGCKSVATYLLKVN